jgi:hypothetical protein
MHALAQYALSNPPRCLAGLQVEPLTSLGYRIAHHPHPAFAYFSVRAGCDCEQPGVFLLGHRPPLGGNRVQAASSVRCFFGDALLLAPYAVGCPDCGATRGLMDPRQHGYDGERGANSNPVGEGERTRYRCLSCAGESFAVIAGFRYHDHDSYFAQILKACRRPQDDFEEFILLTRCRGCGAVSSVAWLDCM